MAIDPNSYLQMLQTGGSLAMGANPYVAAGQMALGGIQTAVALARLNQLKQKPWAQFSNNLALLQQNVSMWQDRTNAGIPQSYQNQAYSTAAMQNASAYRNIQDMSGGQMGAAFGRIGAMDRTRLGLNLAQMNDQARREAMGYLANARSQVVSQMNMQTQADRQLRMMQEQALGGALRAGTQNLTQGFDYTVMPQLQKMWGTPQSAAPQTVPQVVAPPIPNGPITPPLPMGTPANLPQERTYNQQQWEVPGTMSAPQNRTLPANGFPLNHYSGYTGNYPDATQGGFFTPPLPTGTPVIFR